ncbi:MAG: glycosyltransferase family 2 protein [Bacteroidales bacterium]|jgi:glycosyltransferase involved in cell wall biosynthesis|nr:glycosyltransferase family 2 protein [Bacteroidales bacterium]
MPKISAVIITFNEEKFIGRCLDSLQGVADEIVVVDSFSTDRTEDICRQYGALFFTHPFGGFRDQKNHALSLASYSHVLSIDADEALSEELRSSILAMGENWKYDGYFVNRRNIYCGKRIKYSGWYPDRQLRLFSTGAGEWGGHNIHERVVMHSDCSVGRLEGDLLHWNFTSVAEHVEKMKHYSETCAREYHRAGKKASFFSPFVHGFWTFFRTYILNAGFLDGRYGCIICWLNGKTAYVKYKRLRILNRQKGASVKTA